MFEWRLDPPNQLDVELYVRDTSLDVARVPTVDGLPDPEAWPSPGVLHFLSRNIKVDVPTPTGWQTTNTDIDFLQFNDVIVDGSQGVGTLAATDGTVRNRVYVEVHNRGIVKANSVRATLLVTQPSVALAPLPTGYETNIANGSPITNANWQTVGSTILTDLRGGFPQVAYFELPSTMLPPPADLPANAHHCSVAFVHSVQDPYTSTNPIVDSLTVADRKVAQRNLNVVGFVGIPPGNSDTWVAVDVFGVDKKEEPNAVRIDLRRFEGRLSLLLPRGWTAGKGFHETRQHEVADAWAAKHQRRLKTFIKEKRFNAKACERMMKDIDEAVRHPLVTVEGGSNAVFQVDGIRLGYGERMPLFLRIESKQLEKGAVQDIDILQYKARSRVVLGGCRWRLAGPSATRGTKPLARDER
jgi:hypothetical protein